MDIENMASDDRTGNRVRRKHRRKVVIDWECVNSECRVIGTKSHNMINGGKVQVKTATNYVIAFYGQGSKENEKAIKQGEGVFKKRKVCFPCDRKAIEAQDKMIENLLSGDAIIKEKLFPTPKDVVLIEDSDEEPISDTSSESEIELEFEEREKTNPLDTVSELENQLEIKVNAALNRLNVEEEITSSMKILNDRLDNLQPDYDATKEAFKNIEKEVDRIREEFYAPFRPIPNFLEPLDLNKAELDAEKHEESYRLQPSNNELASVHGSTDFRAIGLTSVPTTQAAANLPPAGKLDRPELILNQKVYAVRGNILNVWKTADVVDIVPGTETKYKLRFETLRQDKGASSNIKTLTGKHLAYEFPASVRLQVGTRIIGIYNDNQQIEEQPQTSQPVGEYYSGIVAEPPKAMNKHRYLVFFDDGYASYISHKDIRIVCRQTDSNSTSGVWDDIHPNSRDFIKKYLLQYPERPMVRLIQGQIVRTEWEGSWWYTRVDAVDASLVKLIFHVNSRKESIYRGSTRLEPLYLEMQQQKKRAEQISLNKQAAAEGDSGKIAQNVNRFMPRNRIEGFKKNRPYVEYTRQVEPDSPTQHESQPIRRSVAKKSTAAKRPTTDSVYEPSVTKLSWDQKGCIQATELDRVEGVPFIKHQCSVNCLADQRYQYKETQMLGTNPLLIPIALGWKREICRFRNYGRRCVYYVSPCGRRLRDFGEVHRYLRITNSLLEMDFFNFEWYVRVYNEFQPEREFYRIQDISYGKENFAVSCVNSLDKNYPEYVEYSQVRIPQSTVKINTDENFMVSCDCEDDCQDKSKCACWQLSIHQTDAAPGMKGRSDSNIGYVYRRLLDNVPSGIFECNSRCKCKSTCLNRVAQKPMRVRLQVFKTEKRGWGIRALNDIPAGGFICIYVGNLYSNDEANRQGQDFGDEYFAELDMIESVEGRKEGYESDVDDELLSDDMEKDDSGTEEESNKEDGEYSMPNCDRKNNGNRLTKERPRREIRGFNPKGEIEDKEKKEKVKHISTRKFYGENEDVFIMDAKSIGNIGRYLNHSCNPNVFVQNCFVDTHDLRFPWVAFFASVHIPAGQELCWDYQYIVDQVKGKEIYCQCGSENCRGRLL